MDTRAGLLQQLHRSCDRDADIGRQVISRSLNDGHVGAIEQVHRKILVVLDAAPVRTALADHSAAIRIQIERAFRLVAAQPGHLVQQIKHAVATLLESGCTLWDEALRAVERHNGGSLAD